MATSVMWFRRDLRTVDNPALTEAAKADDTVALFVLDSSLLKAAGAARIAFLFDCLRALDEELGGKLVVRDGPPSRTVLEVARQAGASSVFVTEEFEPYGRQRDSDVEIALREQDITLHRVDSNYAVAPGDVVKRDGTPFQVFTPYSRSWAEHGWGSPVPPPARVHYLSLRSDGIPPAPPVAASLPKGGQREATARLDAFLANRLQHYKDARDLPASGGTSRLSPYLKFGCIHPRQILARLGVGEGASTFRTELCWRDFYADVLFHRPDTLEHAFQPKMAHMKVDAGQQAEERFAAWKAGLTGYPIVDAGMRQLMAEAWMHNRLRMIVASFLIKDLHCDWTWGAQHFMDLLVDGDLASNVHGWQWVAGTGTDASPYFRIFNPVTQGKKFDSDGQYIRKWVPELRNLDVRFVHEPWKCPDGIPPGYVPPMVDHDVERKESLARYAALKSAP